MGQAVNLIALKVRLTREKLRPGLLQAPNWDSYHVIYFLRWAFLAKLCEVHLKVSR